MMEMVNVGNNKDIKAVKIMHLLGWSGITRLAWLRILMRRLHPTRCQTVRIVRYITFKFLTKSMYPIYTIKKSIIYVR